MPALHELQRRFAAATLFDDSGALAALGVSTSDKASQARLRVYRGNVFGNYRKALAASYPVTRRLVGGAFFDAAVDAFVRAHPSTSGDLNGYGDALAVFLDHYPPARSLAYLPDVARLEWLFDQANLAADAPALDVRALAALSPEALPALRLALQPAARLLASRYPVLRIWQANQPDRDGTERVDLQAGGEHLLIGRSGRGPWIERIAHGEHEFLRALAARLSLEDALARASALDPAFDLGASLHRRAADGTLTPFPPPRPAKAAR